MEKSWKIIKFYRKIIKNHEILSQNYVTPNFGFTSIPGVYLKNNYEISSKKARSKIVIFYTISVYLCWKNNFIFSIFERIIFRFSVYLSRKNEAKNDDFFSRPLLAAGWLATGFTVLIVKVI